MKIDTSQLVSEIVTEDYRAAAVFQSHGIDFCCGGNITIGEACEKSGISQDNLIEELTDSVREKTDNQIDYLSWPLDLLTDYIQKKHHRYVEAQIPVLREYLDTVCGVHGSKHPELLTIAELFHKSADELTKHMKKEELILFPFIRKLCASSAKKQIVEKPGFGSVKNPIENMLQEHANEGERFRKISELSNQYTPPAEACNTYKVTFFNLKAFEEDLHLHIHLENNILFPKALALEKQMMMC